MKIEAVYCILYSYCKDLRSVVIAIREISKSLVFYIVLVITKKVSFISISRS